MVLLTQPHARQGEELDLEDEMHVLSFSSSSSCCATAWMQCSACMTQQHRNTTYPQLLPWVEIARSWALPLAALLRHLQEVVQVEADQAWTYSTAHARQRMSGSITERSMAQHRHDEVICVTRTAAKTDANSTTVCCQQPCPDIVAVIQHTTCLSVPAIEPCSTVVSRNSRDAGELMPEDQPDQCRRFDGTQVT